jgi:hypothetical protein
VSRLILRQIRLFVGIRFDDRARKSVANVSAGVEK